MHKLKIFWTKHKRYKLRQELINLKCTPEIAEKARATHEANKKFLKSLEGCCGWYFGGVQSTHLRRWGRGV